MSGLTFDLSRVPFSRAGSYLAISALPDHEQHPAGLYLRTVHGDAQRLEICRLELIGDGEAPPIATQATPSALELATHSGTLQIIFADLKTLRFFSNDIDSREISGTGAVLVLSFQIGLYDHAVQRRDGWQINSFSNRSSYALTATAGVCAVDVDTDARLITVRVSADPSGVLDFCLTEFSSTWPQLNNIAMPSFADAKHQIDVEFNQWLVSMPTISQQYQESEKYISARELAAYVTWSALVAAEGHLQRPAMYMSKNWMINVWSWDHCFNAMMLSYGNPTLAWDQFMLLFDVQGSDALDAKRAGVLPDCASDKLLVWNFCKPPVHGWALAWMMKRTAAIGETQLQEIYAPLCRWTEWWFSQRDDAGDGIPHYNHGNDSGWDNSTLFDVGVPLQTPDLSALLIIQMTTLADIAQRLKKSGEASQWQQRADDLMTRMLKLFWRDDHFVAVSPITQQAVCSDTLLLIMPIILGNKLPKTIREKLVDSLKKKFLTKHGLATENPASQHYQADSYWRGPIWAPVILLVMESLNAIGERDLADLISRRFCETVARNGMAENFDALTGVGLRDPAHTWTASVFIILAHAYLN